MSECVRTGKQEERISWAKGLWAIAMGALLVSYLLLMALFTNDYAVPVWLQIIRVTVAVAGLILGKVWKDRGFRFLALFWLLMFFRVFLENPMKLTPVSVSEALLNGIWAFLGCYSLGKVLTPKQLKTFLKVAFGIWTMGTVISSLLGLYAAWIDKSIWNLTRGALWGLPQGDSRLYLVYLPTVAGPILSVSVIISILMAFTCEKRITKILYGLVIIPMLMALSLTDTRAAQISVSAGIGVIVCVWILWKWGYRLPREKRKTRLGVLWAIAVGTMFLLFVGAVVLQTKFIDVFNRIKADGGLIATAMAEEAQKTTATVLNRGFFGDDILNGRPKIWSSALKYLRENPIYLLTGASIHAPMEGVIILMGQVFGHCHCMPLQILLESGIPGVLLMGGFVVCVAASGLRLIRSEEKPLWQRLTVAPVICLMIGELVECTTSLVYSWPQLPLFFLFAGIVTALGQKTETKDRKA